MYEKICERCRRVCFTPEQFESHECFDAADNLDAEIALANWDGKLPSETTDNEHVSEPFRGILNGFIRPQR